MHIPLHRNGLIGALAAAALLGAATTANAQTLYWDFGSGTTPTAFPTTNTTTNLTVTEGVTQGNNNGTTTTLTTTSASSGYTGASGSYNAGAAARTGALATGASGSAFFEFAITPAAGFSAQITGLTFGSRSTGTGPVSYSITTADLTSTLGSAALAGTNTSTWALQPSAITSFTAPVNTPLTLRIYGYGGTGSASASTANWRIDDLTVTANAVGGGTAATPEPGAIALLGVGLLPLGTIARRRFACKA